MQLDSKEVVFSTMLYLCKVRHISHKEISSFSVSVYLNIKVANRYTSHDEETEEEHSICT